MIEQQLKNFRCNAQKESLTNQYRSEEIELIFETTDEAQA
jgi:hypothetical protein